MGAEHLRPWKKGQSGNPTGMPRIPDYLRGIASLTQLEVVKVISKYARMTRAELQIAATDANTPMLEVAIASVFAQAAKNGDYTRLSFLLDRAIGKVPVIEPTDEEAAALKDIRDLSDQELLRLVKEKIPELEKPSA